MTRRHALPLHVSEFGIQWLPPNHELLRLALVQSMPTPWPSASLSTFVNQARRSSDLLKGSSSWKPMNEVQGACSTMRQKYSSGGSVASGIGLEFTKSVAFVGTTAGQALPCPKARPLGLSHGNRNRFP